LVDVIEGRCRLRQAMIRDKHFQELYLIPAAQTRDKSAVSPDDMQRLCDELRSEVDWILLDSPAGIERGFRNAIAPADEAIVVTNPEVSAVRDADRVIGLLEAEEKHSVSLLINRLNPAMVRSHDMLSAEDVLDLLAVKLIGIVPEDENVIVATNRGTPIVLDDRSRAGRAFRNVARRLQGDEVQFLDMDYQSNLWSRISRLAGGRR
jgi:septum site-determining protein MinD